MERNMEGEEGIRLSKRINNGEVDYKTKAGTAWSHSYLNQKPWHPLSYPNQRRKWIAEQTHAQRQRRAEEVAREHAQEQEFFRQTALISKKEKEKIEMMKAVSFMYVRPPGYNAESAKAAEIADNAKTSSSSAAPSELVSATDPSTQVNKNKPRPKDAFGRPLPTEQEFEVLHNAPRLETGVPARAKPFGIEVRNVKCVRCGKYGHQSGDRDCPLKDVIMPNEEGRLKRDDPLTAIMAHTDPREPLKWELKQKPGMSPPRGGFNPDDPNQQIVAEDIFDEYGGFLSGGNIPELLTNFSSSKLRKKSKQSKHKRESSPRREFGGPEDSRLSSSPSDNGGRRLKKEKKKKVKEKEKKKKKKLIHSESSSSDELESYRRSRNSKHKHSFSSEDSDSKKGHRSKKCRHKHYDSFEESDHDRHHRRDNSEKHSYPSERSLPERHWRSEKNRNKRSYPHLCDDSDYDGHRRKKHH